jgi:hypothetical protein
MGGTNHVAIHPVLAIVRLTGIYCLAYVAMPRGVILYRRANSTLWCTRPIAVRSILAGQCPSGFADKHKAVTRWWTC